MRRKKRITKNVAYKVLEIEIIFAVVLMKRNNPAPVVLGEQLLNIPMNLLCGQVVLKLVREIDMRTGMKLQIIGTINPLPLAVLVENQEEVILMKHFLDLLKLQENAAPSLLKI
jgi:hypothetical protein